MALKNKHLLAKQNATRLACAKKVMRLHKKLRTIRLNNNSLKSTNKELVLTIQHLKDNLREADNKLRNLNGELCSAISLKNTFQESFNKLVGILPELTTVLQGTTSVVSKVYGTLTETNSRAFDSLRLSRSPMLFQPEQMQQSSETAHCLLDKLRALGMACQVATQPSEIAPSSGTVPRESSSERTNGNHTESESSSSGTWSGDRVSSNGFIGPKTFYRTYSPVLSPVSERASRLTNIGNEEQNEEFQPNTSIIAMSLNGVESQFAELGNPSATVDRNTEENIEDNDEVSIELSHHSHIAEKAPTLPCSRIKNEVLDVDNEEEVHSNSETEIEDLDIEEQKVGALLSVNSIPIFEKTSNSTSNPLLSDTIKSYANEETLRSPQQQDSLTIIPRDPGPSRSTIIFSELPTLPCPSSDMTLPEITLDPESSSLNPVKFSNVFPRRRKALTPNTSLSLSPSVTLKREENVELIDSLPDINTEDPNAETHEAIESIPCLKTENVPVDSKKFLIKVLPSMTLTQPVNEVSLDDECASQCLSHRCSSVDLFANPPLTNDCGNGPTTGTPLKGPCTSTRSEQNKTSIESKGESKGKPKKRKKSEAEDEGTPTVRTTRASLARQFSPRSSPRFRSSAVKCSTPRSSRNSSVGRSDTAGKGHQISSIPNTPKRKNIKNKSSTIQTSGSNNSDGSQGRSTRRAVKTYKEPSLRGSPSNSVAPVSISVTPISNKKQRNSLDRIRRSLENDLWFCTICNENKKISMIECIHCKFWFHMMCAKVSPTQKSFFCKGCKK